MQEFALKGNFKDDKVEQEVTAAYKADKYAIKASVSPAGKVCHSTASLALLLDVPSCATLQPPLHCHWTCTSFSFRMSYLSIAVVKRKSEHPIAEDVSHSDCKIDMAGG